MPIDDQGITRRELLTAGATLSAGSMLVFAPDSVRAEPGRTIELPGADELVPENMPQGFSAAEIERRWTKMREWMRREKFDCLLVPSRPQGNADVKWLTESVADWVIFPLHGQPTLVFRRSQERDEIEAESPVKFDLRMSRFERSRILIDRLGELGLQKARIGVGNLSGVMRNDEGGVSYVTMTKLTKALPKATFESAVTLLMRVKLQRGKEEVNALRLASRAAELAVRAIVEKAGVGVLQRDVWFHVFKSLLDATGEAVTTNSIRGGHEANTARGRPLSEPFLPGQICGQELAASVLGYYSQVNHSLCVGPPAPKHWPAAFNYVVDIFETLLDAAKPGVSFEEWSQLYRKLVEKRGNAWWGVVWHTGGALGDGPRGGPTRPDENSDLVMRPGMVFTVKPRFAIEGVEAPSAQFGDAILITENAAERLGRRKPELITLGV